MKQRCTQWKEELFLSATVYLCDYVSVNWPRTLRLCLAGPWSVLDGLLSLMPFSSLKVSSVTAVTSAPVSNLKLTLVFPSNNFVVQEF